jgi:plastocyanin
LTLEDVINKIDSMMPSKLHINYLLLLSLAVVFLVFSTLLFQDRTKPASQNNYAPSLADKYFLNNDVKGSSVYSFSDSLEIVSFENSVPMHGEVLAGVPINVVVNFKSKVFGNSHVYISRGEYEYSQGEAIIDSDTNTLRTKMDPNSPDGIYKVVYTMCTSANNCQEGYFQFAIDRKLSAQFADFRGRDLVNVVISNLSFNNSNIIISKGTKVVWINRDQLEHTIKSVPYPEHNYFPEQNSYIMGRSDTFSMVFNKQGIYPYYGGSYPESMSGYILVE